VLVAVAAHLLAVAVADLFVLVIEVFLELNELVAFPVNTLQVLPEGVAPEATAEATSAEPASAEPARSAAKSTGSTSSVTEAVVGFSPRVSA
jgi:hypothetical protein